MSHLYLDSDALCALCAEKTAPAILYSLRPELQKGTRIVLSSLSISEVCEMFFTRRDSRQLREFLSLFLPFADEFIAEETADLERAIDTMDLCSVEFRPARHASMLLNRRMHRILSADPAYDRVPGLERIGPPSSEVR